MTAVMCLDIHSIQNYKKGEYTGDKCVQEVLDELALVIPKKKAGEISV